MLTRSANRPSDRERAKLADSLWPGTRLGEAVYALAEAAGLPSSAVDAPAPPPGLEPHDVTTWIEAVAAQGGTEANHLTVAVGDVSSLAATATPVLLSIDVSGEPYFLAVVNARGGTLSTIGPDLRARRLRMRTVDEQIRRPFEARVAAEIDRAVNQMPISARARDRARGAMLADRIKALPFDGVWLLRLPAGSDVAREAHEIGLPRRVIALLATHVTQYALFLASWWLLGQALLDGTVDRGWLWGWVLLLLSLVPLRMLTSWIQGEIAITVGAWLKRRLLRGALRVDRQTLRRSGPGQLFGIIVEAGAVESMSLSGGVVSVLATIEVAFTAGVMVMGGGVFAGGVLAAWAGLVAFLAWRYVGRRQAWTRERLSMTDYLVECMVGHRTRLAQQPAEQHHLHEDASLNRYIESARSMDHAFLMLTGVIPRGWLVLSIGLILPIVVATASTQQLAITVGGMMLGYRALRRLCVGLSAISSAVIAGHTVLPLVRAAAAEDLPTPPSLAVRSRRNTGEAAVDEHAVDARSHEVLAHAKDIAFRYRANGEAVLRGCSLRVPTRVRLLLEGASGAGKTTFLSILAGLQAPDSGLLLLNGLDRSVLRTAGWRSRVVMAPQPHDNYLVGATLAFNLLVGRRWPAREDDLAEAEQVCRELGLGDLIDRMPGGLQQVVGETGWQLSQGERARVFLARAILQDPDLLLLDESWGNLDPENVERVTRCITERAPAVIAIAHT